MATKDSLVRLRLASSKKVVWEAEAASAGLSLSAWLERAADDEVLGARAVREDEARRLRDMERLTRHLRKESR